MESGTRQTTHRRTMPNFDDLLLRETNHRCANDLQLVVSLLALQSRRATNPETQQSLHDAMERVSILARSRAALRHQTELSLEAALRQVCEALHSQAEPRSILISLTVGQYHQGLSSPQIMTVALAVNELSTNAIKHAFAEGVAGRIQITLRNHDDRHIVVLIDDDGLPFPETINPQSGGLGLGLVKRLVAAIGGLVIVPTHGSKIFELRIPVDLGGRARS